METGSMPTSNDEWFAKHVIDGLARLENGQAAAAVTQRAMHEANVKRMDEFAGQLSEHQNIDSEAFSKLRIALSELQPVKRLVYAAVGLILIGVVGGILALVMNKPAAAGAAAAPTSARP